MKEPVSSCPSGSYENSSNSAPPNPCTVPPWIWPSTSIGFTTTPQSCTMAYF